MKQDIEIIGTLSKVERVKRGNISAKVRTESGRVTAVEAGEVTDPDTGVTIASFSQWEGSGLQVQFMTSDCDEIVLLTEIKTFINDIKE